MRIGPVYIDAIIALLFIYLVYVLHTKTSFGRNVMAIGNDVNAAQTVGINTNKVLFTTFVLSGLFASVGGFFNAMQLGGVTLHMGQGLEFSAIAMIVVGGISLFGGEGSIFPGFLLGVFTLNLIENGLNHMGASPYAYPFFRGGVIFVAMFADTLKARVRRLRRGLETET
jgi:ribose/xylose/arabinose/galactoside ABC-type transport system permease subunit